MIGHLVKIRYKILYYINNLICWTYSRTPLVRRRMVPPGVARAKATSQPRAKDFFYIIRINNSWPGKRCFIVWVEFIYYNNKYIYIIHAHTATIIYYYILRLYSCYRRRGDARHVYINQYFRGTAATHIWPPKRPLPCHRRHRRARRWRQHRAGTVL